jgi:hypothetical protein
VRFGFLNRAYSTLVIYMNTTNVQREYKAQPSDSTGVPVNDNRPNRTGNVVPMRKRFGKQENADKNPFHETMDETFSKQYTNPVNSNINRVERKYARPTQNQYRTTNVPQVRKRVNHKKKKASMEAKMIARLKLAPINAWVVGWSITWYLAFQWWMGLISLAGLGIGYSVYSSISPKQGPDGATLFDTTIGTILNTFSRAVRFVAEKVFGLEFDPLIIFLVPSAILLLLGLFFLLTICAMYSAAGVKPLTGQHLGLKIFTFVIAWISCVTPLPLIFLWLAIVWIYPK